MIFEPTLEKKINDFKRFTIDEINKAMRAKANYLAALGLSAYTEFLGGLYLCKLEDRQSRKNYDFGLTKLGSEYNNLLKKYPIEVYSRIRCGLVHEFFIKGTTIIWLENSNCKCGIEIDSKKNINFYPRKYLEDFEKAIDTYIEDIKKDQKLKDYFLKSWRFERMILASGAVSSPPKII